MLKTTVSSISKISQQYNHIQQNFREIYPNKNARKAKIEKINKKYVSKPINQLQIRRKKIILIYIWSKLIHSSFLVLLTLTLFIEIKNLSKD